MKRFRILLAAKGKDEENRSKDVDKSTVGKRFNANRKSKGENRPKKNHNIKKKKRNENE